jgi:hypothetical protein
VGVAIGWEHRLALVLACTVVLGTACGTSSTGNGGGSGGQPSSTLQPSATPTETSSAEPSRSVEPPAADLSGTWQGTWANTTPDDSTGTFQLDWAQEGAKLSGTITISGTPCLAGADITGKVHGKQIYFGIVSGQVEVNYTGTVSGDSMSGTYATSCGNAEGDWEASKTG